VLYFHKEGQLPTEPIHYGKESPIIMNLVPVRNKYEKNHEIGKSVGDRFAITF
jgi:hypothetical protein